MNLHAAWESERLACALGEAVRDRRLSRSLSLADAATHFGVTTWTILRWEAGRIPGETAILLAKFFDIDVRRLA